LLRLQQVWLHRARECNCCLQLVLLRLLLLLLLLPEVAVRGLLGV
jgi:hypothetical protein